MVVLAVAVSNQSDSVSDVAQYPSATLIFMFHYTRPYARRSARRPIVLLGVEFAIVNVFVGRNIQNGLCFDVRSSRCLRLCRGINFDRSIATAEATALWALVWAFGRALRRRFRCGHRGSDQLFEVAIAEE